MSKAAKKTDSPKAKAVKKSSSVDVLDRSIVTKNKKSIHPQYKMIKVINTKGETWLMCSTYKSDELKLNSDRFTHSAWTKDGTAVDHKADKVAKFQNRYGNLFKAPSSAA